MKYNGQILNLDHMNTGTPSTFQVSERVLG